jgi:O-antigen ligase
MVDHSQGTSSPPPRRGVFAQPAGGQAWRWTLWLLIMAMAFRISFLIRQRRAGDFASVDGYATFQILVILATAIMLLVSPVAWSTFLRLKTSSLKYGVGLYALGAVSAVWSPQPVYSLFRATEALVEILAICTVVCSLRDWLAGEKMLVLTFLLLLSFHFGGLIRSNGLGLSFHSFHTNSYSASAAMALCFSAGELLRRQNTRMWSIFVAAAGALAIGTSAGSNIAALLGLLTVGILQPRGKRWRIVALAVVLGALAVLAGSQGVRQILAPGKTDAELQDLSARTTLWENYSQAFFDNPLIGQGFAVTARISTLYETNTHNSLLAVLTGTGLLGLAVTLAWLFSASRECFDAVKHRQPFAVGFTGSLVAGWINAMSCAYIGEGWSTSTLTFFMLAAFFARFSLADAPLRSGAQSPRQRRTALAYLPRRPRTTRLAPTLSTPQLSKAYNR